MYRMCLLLTVVGVVASSAWSQDQANEVDLSHSVVDDGLMIGPDGGSDPWELIISGGGSNDKDFDNGGFNLNVEAGYYFTPELFVGVRQGIGFADFGDSSWSGSTSAAFDYHFNFERLRPFLGVSFGGIYGDDVEETFIAGPEAGVKYYVKNDTFIYGRVAYEFLFEDADDADDAFDEGRFVYVVGIGFNF